LSIRAVTTEQINELISKPHFSSMTYDQRVNGVWMICQNIVLNRFYMRLITGDPCKKASKPAMFAWIDHYLGEVADVDV
jgi:hypothetical protein